MMRMGARVLVVALMCLLPVFPARIVPALQGLELSPEDSDALGICRGVIHLFQQFPDAVWPGYNLAERPFIFYMPGRWALLLNYSGGPEGFTPYPQDWPDLGTEAMLYEGQYGGLVGQLAFNLPIDSVKVVAVGFQERSPLDVFGYIVHENFHQYQFGAFGEIHWEREERYPIQERDNTAMAYLEMRLLMDALELAAADKEQECRDCLSQFVAVRYLRWERADPFVRSYEQGEEINEGTAQYVEMKSIALLKQMDVEGPGGRLAPALSDELSSTAMPDYLLGDFRERLTGNSISPADMSRYRIYPVGSAQGLLLDYLGIDWKRKAQAAGPEFTFAGLFKDHLNIDKDRFESLLAKAKEKYAYDEVLAATDRLIQEYEAGFKTELAAFESQPGYRLEVDLSTRGESLSRSRSSSAAKWVVDNGTRELRKHYNVYVLKSDKLLIELQDMGVLEEYDWDAGWRQVVFLVDEMPAITLDGTRLEAADGNAYRFDSIEILGDRAKVSYSKPGTVTVSGRDLKVNLVPPPD
jgi:hypothetical protein